MTADTSPTVLVVEDEQELADLYAVWLEDRFDVLTAYSGEAALSYLGEADVVFLDRRMPGLAGDDVLDEIRERDLDCRVAMVTAVDPDFDILDMPFDDYLVKPVSRDALYDATERLLARSTYDDWIDEFAALASKRAALKVEKDEAELASNPQFAELEERIERLRPDLDSMARGFDESDVASVLRDVPEIGT